MKVLADLGVEVMTAQKVVEVTEGLVKTAAGREVPSDFPVWAAGIRGAEVLKDIGGLESNRLNQLVVQPTLQTTRDPDVFAIGDCAACPWQEGKLVPPRAQAAHQQASHLVKTISGRLRGVPPKPYRYRDFGSLVSLGAYDTLGPLIGLILREEVRLEGWLPRVIYVFLH